MKVLGPAMIHPSCDFQSLHCMMRSITSLGIFLQVRSKINAFLCQHRLLPELKCHCLSEVHVLARATTNQNPKRPKARVAWIFALRIKKNCFSEYSQAAFVSPLFSYLFIYAHAVMKVKGEPMHLLAKLAITEM